MSFDVEVGFASQRGPRERNEDFAAVGRRDPSDAGQRGDALIAAIADGVSRGGAGLEAAQTTVLALVDDFFATPATWEATAALDRLLDAQNRWLASSNARRADAALCTLTALVLEGQRFIVAHVGDTRASLLRDHELQQLTHRHTFDQPDRRNQLTRAVGLDDHLHVDYTDGVAQPGDLFMLTSDGVHETLSPRQLVGWPMTPPEFDAAALAERIVAEALAQGSRDNATAVIIRVRGTASDRLAEFQRQVRDLPAVRALRPGDRLDRFVIEALLADNGVHRVYRAHTESDPQGAADALPDTVVLKTLHEARHSDSAERDMLAHEAWLGSVLTHQATHGFVRLLPNPGATASYLVFDYHEGRTLEERLDAGETFSIEQIVRALIEISDALSRLHRLGVIHRDIKPANLHCDAIGRWRILDLSVALSGREPPEQRALHAGTPSYMNPEQWDDAAPATTARWSNDPACDLFGLGVVAYRWLSGHLPYGEVEPWQRGAYRRDPRPPSRLRPDVPVWLDHCVLRAVAIDPRQRFETADELLLALERGHARTSANDLRTVQPTPLLTRDPMVLLKVALAISLLFNALLMIWLLFLPR